MPSDTARAKAFSKIVLEPTHAAYLQEATLSRVSDPATRHLYLGMLACWRLVILIAKARSETVQDTFRREASACFQLHVVRTWALAEPRTRYPRWVKPRPGRDEPIDLGHCFHRTATHLMQAADAL
jgi:hypothetical protein